jgi:hypothetical protein
MAPSQVDINNPFLCGRVLSHVVDTPHRAYEAVWRTPEAPIQSKNPIVLFWGLSGSRVNACCVSLRIGPRMSSFVSVLTCIIYLYFSLLSVWKTSYLLLSATVLHTPLFVGLVAEDRWNRSTRQWTFQWAIVFPKGSKGKLSSFIPRPMNFAVAGLEGKG